MNAFEFCLFLFVPFSIWTIEGVCTAWHEIYREIARDRAMIRRDMIARARNHE